MTTHPGDLRVDRGGDADFSVRSYGTLPLYPQWRRDGVNLLDGPTPHGSTIAGSSTEQLIITHAQPEDEGVYDCVIANSCGSVTSDSAELAVACPADINDDDSVDIRDFIAF